MHAQHHITINATLDPENKSLYIVQEIVYKNIKQSGPKLQTALADHPDEKGDERTQVAE